jgi:hypothetical protein
MPWAFQTLAFIFSVIALCRSFSGVHASPEQLLTTCTITSNIDLWNFYRIAPVSQPSSSLSTSPGSVFTPPQPTTIEEADNSATQLWYLEAIPQGQQARASANDSNRYYRLRNVVTGPCCSLGVLDDGDGTVGVGRSMGGPASEWAVTRVDGKPGQWQITSNDIGWDPNTARRRLGLTADLEVYLAEADEMDSEALNWQVLAVVRRMDSPSC